MKPGDTFSTLAQLDDSLKKLFEDSNKKHCFSIKDSRHLPEKDPNAANLFYSSIRLVCICSGKCMDITDSNRKRKKSIKCDCPARMHISIKNGNLIVTKFMEDHNHEALEQETSSDVSISVNEQEASFSKKNTNEQNHEKVKNENEEKATKAEEEEEEEKEYLDASTQTESDKKERKSHASTCVENSTQTEEEKEKKEYSNVSTQTESDKKETKSHASTQTIGEDFFINPKFFKKKNILQKSKTILKWLGLNDHIVYKILDGNCKLSKAHLNEINVGNVNEAFFNSLCDVKVLQSYCDEETLNLVVQLQKDQKSKLVEKCGKCNKGEGRGNKKTQWILCDACLKWYHFKCENILKSPNKDEDYLCRSCALK